MGDRDGDWAAGPRTRHFGPKADLRNITVALILDSKTVTEALEKIKLLEDVATTGIPQFGVGSDLGSVGSCLDCDLSSTNIGVAATL